MNDGPHTRPAAPPGPGRWIDAGLARAGVTGVLARDAVGALALALVSLAVFTSLSRLSEMDSGSAMTATQTQVVTIAGVAQALPLCLRRIRPGLCFVLVAALQLVLVAVMPEATARGFSPLVAAYTLGTLAPVRCVVAAAAAAALAEGATAAIAAAGGEAALLSAANHFGSSAVTYAAAAFVGVHVAARRAHLAMVWERAEEAVEAQRERTRSALAAERNRIARELHDVAAHHLSGMVVQAAAVERQVDRDPAAARSGAAAIRAQGKSTLGNLRQVVGLLREDGEAEHAPVPGLDALDALVADARALGDRVDFTRAGDPVELPPIAGIALYRIAQQSLTNARQHASGAAVRVRLDYGPGTVVLDVVNGPGRAEPGTGGGTGLIGMRERADLVGAAIELGPEPDGGWRVRARLRVPDLDRDTNGART